MISDAKGSWFTCAALQILPTHGGANGSIVGRNTFHRLRDQVLDKIIGIYQDKMQRERNRRKIVGPAASPRRAFFVEL